MKYTWKDWNVLWLIPESLLISNLSASSDKVKLTAYTALVRPILEYGAAAWDPYTKKSTKQLEMVQRSAVRWVGNNYEREPGTVTALLDQYKLCTLESRRKNMRLCMMYKIVHEEVDIPKEVYLKSAQRRTRGSHEHKYQTISARTDVYKYSFFPRTVTDWDSLDPDIAESSSLTQFKGRLLD